MKNMQKAKARFKAKEKEKQRRKVKDDIPSSETSSSFATSTSNDSLQMKRNDLRYFGTSGQVSHEEEFDGNPFQSFFFR